MAQKLSQRLAEIVEALPLKPGIRILEIGCGTGAAAREIAQRIGDGYILGIDRSSKAIGQALKSSEAEILKGSLNFRQVEIENFELGQYEEQFDIAFAVRVGALDGRHPEIEREAIAKIAKMLKPDGKLFIDGGNPLKEICWLL
ncbi:methyltransferase domain-containing protein [Pseudopedobacter sp.]|uniref:SAM-dependent methyltransferase n=1 Tax=Pseudopedobacter sp. TaxID=1936787 RepID=UPI00333FD679